MRCQTERHTSRQTFTFAKSSAKERLRDSDYPAKMNVNQLNLNIMKKRFFLLAALMATAVSPAVSQLKVLTNGQTLMGGLQDTSSLSNDISTAIVLGPNDNNSGGYLSFGPDSRVRIGEWRNSEDPTSDSDIMLLTGYRGLRGSFFGRFIFSCTSRYLFSFTSNVEAPSFVTTSDGRLKKNVSDIDNDVIATLGELNAVKYNLTAGDGVQTASDKTSDSTLAKASSEADSIVDNRTRYGFIAQEVRKLYPDLVVEDENGWLGIDYTGFIPLLVEAVKSLRAENVELREEMDAMKNGIRRVNGMEENASMRDIEAGSVISLSQNRPNPFSESTVIDCTIPESVAEATLFIYDLQGKQVSRHDIDTRGTVSVKIEGNTLQAGMYVYTLVADSVQVDTKRMILTK